MNKGVTLIEILIYISLVFIVVVGMYALSEIDSNNELNYEACQHVFVVSSEYNWWLQQYRTISRCSKCGMVI
jgi:Tfp pilus assembly protein PilV